LVFSVTETRPVASLSFAFGREQFSYTGIWPIYCPQIGAAATALRPAGFIPTRSAHDGRATRRDVLLRLTCEEAAGQAKLTGQLGVCAGTAGSNHLVAGFYEASRDHAPVLALSGDMPFSPSPAANGVPAFSLNLRRHAADLPS
jgi:hypothetical protein